MTQGQSARHRPSGPAAVYVIHRLDRRRFKLGCSHFPVRRAQELPEHRYGELDLRGSLVMWLPDMQRANQVERAMHKGLAPYRTPAAHRLSGFSEWFSVRGLTPAMRLLGQMPVSGRIGVCPSLRPLLEQTESGVDLWETISPQAVWWGIEDLWMRLACCLCVRVIRGERPQLVIERFRCTIDGELDDLRWPVFDSDTYTWRINGDRGSFVSLMEYEGVDLVLTLNPLRVVEQWIEGKAVASQVRGFLTTLAQGRYRPVSM